MAQIFAGPFCKKGGINQQMLLNPKSSPPHVSEVTKGLIMLELLERTKQHNIPWATFVEWAAKLYSSEKTDIWALQKSVVAPNTRVPKLKKQHNISINQIEPVIRAVLKLSGVKCDRLPKHTVILIESHAVAQCQLAEMLPKDGYNTLHPDGTTKYGHKYAGYQVTTEERTYTLGLRETADGTV